MAATVVLVHGAWHGAWCFDRVLPMLRKAGVAALAIDLPGHGADRGPFTDLAGDAAQVRHHLDRLEGDLVLLGHSYGGAVITEAGVHPGVRHLVYLCAFTLDRRESCVDAASQAGGTISHQGRPDLSAAFVAHPDGTTTLTPEGAATCFYNDCDDSTTSWALSRLGAHPMATLSQSPTAVAWHTTPSTYVVCRDDHAVHPDLQRILARRCTSVQEWPTGHSPFASRPDRLAQLLIELAG